MTISISDPAIEAAIRASVQSGAFADAEDVVRCALDSKPSKSPMDQHASSVQQMTIDELFAPLTGLDIEFERNPSTGRATDL